MPAVTTSDRYEAFELVLFLHLSVKIHGILIF